MNKIFSVIRREFVERVRTKAFVISTVLLPVLMVAMVLLPMVMMGGSDETSKVVLVDGSGSGVGTAVAEALEKQHFDKDDGGKPRYAVEVQAATGGIEAARDTAVERVGAKGDKAQAADGVLVLGAKALESGEARYYGANVGSFEDMARLQQTIGQVFTTRRLAQSGIDPAVVGKAMRPVDLDTTKVADGKITGQSGAASFMIAYFMGFILYLAIIIYGQQTMTSVVEEKTSRIMEVLNSALTPFQMLLGKVLGVGSAGLFQMAIWGGTVFLITSQREHIGALMGVGAEAMQSFPIPTMSASLLAVFLIYFAAGFLLYGAIFAAIGAMCNTVQETQQFAVLPTVLIAVGFFSVFALIGDPNGTLGVTMSFIPLFSPFTMPVRWSIGSVPWLHLAGSLVLVVLTLVACVWLAARIYRTGILMYGKKPGIGELWRWIRAS